MHVQQFADMIRQALNRNRKWTERKWRVTVEAKGQTVPSLRILRPETPLAEAAELFIHAQFHEQWHTYALGCTETKGHFVRVQLSLKGIYIEPGIADSIVLWCDKRAFSMTADTDQCAIRVRELSKGTLHHQKTYGVSTDEMIRRT